MTQNADLPETATNPNIPRNLLGAGLGFLLTTVVNVAAALWFGYYNENPEAQPRAREAHAREALHLFTDQLQRTATLAQSRQHPSVADEQLLLRDVVVAQCSQAQRASIVYHNKGGSFLQPLFSLTKAHCAQMVLTAQSNTLTVDKVKLTADKINQAEREVNLIEARTEEAKRDQQAQARQRRTQVGVDFLWWF